jgi:mannose-6-phosphate isomerase-like protein (cupin superfamily)
MKTHKLKKMATYFLALIGGYLVIGYLLHLVVFPEKKPDVKTYFKPGYLFSAKMEGAHQTVVKQENGHVYCNSELEPFADGPPCHIHTGFDETFEVTKGELSVLVNGKVVKLTPGKKLFVPRGTPHKPFNETAESVIMKGAVAFPEKFAFNLQQVYGLMDNMPGFGKSPSTLFQMSLLASEGFDSYLADGPPVFLQKALGFLIVPISRLMGLKSYYKEYDIRLLNQEPIASQQ